MRINLALFFRAGSLGRARHPGFLSSHGSAPNNAPFLAPTFPGVVGGATAPVFARRVSGRSRVTACSLLLSLRRAVVPLSRGLLRVRPSTASAKRREEVLFFGESTCLPGLSPESSVSGSVPVSGATPPNGGPLAAQQLWFRVGEQVMARARFRPRRLPAASGRTRHRCGPSPRRRPVRWARTRY